MTDREPKIYLLPNLMTAGTMLCGFIAILYIVEKIGPESATTRYHFAIGLILLACVFDVLDGGLARLNGQQLADTRLDMGFSLYEGDSLG